MEKAINQPVLLLSLPLLRRQTTQGSHAIDS